jgi:hypothetical protein
VGATPLAGDPDAAQARLQAWRSRRPQARDWAALEAVLGFDEFLARARRAPFGRWTERLGPRPDLHDIDRQLREALRRDAQAMAGWYPSPWPGPLSRLAAVLDLPALDHLARGAPVPAWMPVDPAWRALVEAAPVRRFAVATGLARTAETGDLLADWIASWLAAAPAHDGFAELAALVLALRRARRGAGPAERAAGAAPDAARLAQLFRRHAATPVAMACELLDCVLDVQRLRAGLVQRALARRAGTVAA